MKTCLYRCLWLTVTATIFPSYLMAQSTNLDFSDDAGPANVTLQANQGAGRFVTRFSDPNFGVEGTLGLNRFSGFANVSSGSTFSFSDIDTVIGTAAYDSVVLNAVGTVRLFNIEQVDGSGGNDHVLFRTAIGGVQGLDAIIDLGGGNDNVDVQEVASAVFRNVESITGSTVAGNEVSLLDNVNNGMLVNLQGDVFGFFPDVVNLNPGTNTIALGGVDLVNGSSANDTLNINAIVGSGTGGVGTVVIDLDGGTDVLNLGGQINSSVAIVARNAEIINGGAGAEVITLEGSVGAQVSGGPGDDTLTGGDGVDTAVYAGLSGNYAVTIGADTVVVTDLVDSDGDEGTDTLQAFEAIRFADVTISLNGGAAPPPPPSGGFELSLNNLNQFQVAGNVITQSDGILRLAGTASITSGTIPLNGSSTVEIDFDRSCSGVDSGENCRADVSIDNGPFTALEIVGRVGSSTSLIPANTLTVGNLNGANAIRLRFRINASSTFERYRLDNIVVRGE